MRCQLCDGISCGLSCGCLCHVLILETDFDYENQAEAIDDNSQGVAPFEDQEAAYRDTLDAR